MEQRDFFISYTKADKAEAEWIAETLIRHGYSVYIQTRDIVPGDVFVKRMEEFMDHSSGFIAVWSGSYSASDFAMWEYRAAFALYNKHEMKTFLPVRVQDYPLLSLYTALVHADLYGVGEAEKTRRLLEAVGYRGAVRIEPNLPVKKPTLARRKGYSTAFVLLVLLYIYWGGNKLSLLLVLLSIVWGGYKLYPDISAKYFYHQGSSYYYGLGVEQDYTKAREYYEQAAEKGNASALNRLGWFYLSGLGVDVDYTKAREYYEQAAKKGYAVTLAVALNNLGYLYDKGLGVEQDYTKARAYYEQAAEKGNAVAFNNLGEIFEFGHGVDVDYTTAEWYYQQAVDKGETESAPGNLGRLRERMKNT